MRPCDEFYRERDRRTVEYLGGAARWVNVPVFVELAEQSAGSPVAQTMVLDIIEMAARIHRTVVIVAPNVELLAKARHAPEETGFIAAAMRTADRVDPCGNHRTARQVPDGAAAVCVGPGRSYWRLSVAGATAVIDGKFHGVSDAGAPVLGAGAAACMGASALGAGAAACMGASALFLQAAGMPVRSGSLSVWDRSEPGPVPTGPDHLPVIDVGTVAVAGAGAVAAALTHWTRLLEVRGDWHFVDFDVVALHNTNRSLGFLPEHAGWPDGDAVAKVSVVTEPVGAHPHRMWFDQWSPDVRPDLVLPLANDRGVRHDVGQRGDALLVHATTGRDWEAQLHRHIPGRDCCIDCRFADLRPASFSCSAGIDPTSGPTNLTPSNDAALPFLSAGAGLLLAGVLSRLSHDGHWADARNWWGWRFLGGRTLLRASAASCRPDCLSVLPPAVIREVATPRWEGVLSP